MRNVILHHHIFKNAGSSIDYQLRQGFTDRWVSLEGEHPWSALTNKHVISFLTENPSICALSSHQARPFFNAPKNLKIHPIILLREPIDRARSSYDYERRLQLSYPSSLAAQRGAKYYVDFYLDEANPYRSIAFINFQTLFLSTSINGSADLRKEVANEWHFQEAKGYIDQLTFFGLTEDFENSMLLFRKILKPIFPTLELANVQINSTPNREQDSALRTKEFAKMIGSGRFERLRSANNFDILLYKFAREKYTKLVANVARQQGA